MTIKYKFDAVKAVEVLLYAAEKSPNIYNALKVLYYADREHLTKYGRLICGDSYVAMSHGAVPSGAYDLIKYARGDGLCWSSIPIEEAFTVQGYNIVPHRRANLDLLSESDVECLDAAIAQYGHLSFRKLRAICHNDAAYKAADENDVIPLEAIVRTLPDGELLLDYLQDS
jgi:uncharacterized phage-associated protein